MPWKEDGSRKNPALYKKRIDQKKRSVFKMGGWSGYQQDPSAFAKVPPEAADTSAASALKFDSPRKAKKAAKELQKQRFKKGEITRRQYKDAKKDIRQSKIKKGSN